jgi:hypothetical protein
MSIQAAARKIRSEQTGGVRDRRIWALIIAIEIFMVGWLAYFLYRHDPIFKELPIPTYSEWPSAYHLPTHENKSI